MADVQHFSGLVTSIPAIAGKCGMVILPGAEPTVPEPGGIWYDTGDDCMVYFAPDGTKTYLPKGTGLAGQVLTSNGVDNVPTFAAAAPVNSGKRSITIHIDGAGGVPSTGIKTRVSIPCACTITGWVLVADAVGDAVIDVKRSTYSGFPTTVSIAGTAKPTLSTLQKNEDLVLTNWGSTALAAGDVLEFNLDSVATCVMLDLTINMTIV